MRGKEEEKLNVNTDKIEIKAWGAHFLLAITEFRCHSKVPASTLLP
jgi:hypothetical protein